jgi:hypothetical protein
LLKGRSGGSAGILPVLAGILRASILPASILRASILPASILPASISQ